MDIQRLRNLTTGILHTKMAHIYEDLEDITGEKGLMTHMLPRAASAVEPWLREHVTDERFWNGKFDTANTGEIDVPTPTSGERNLMFERFKSQPNPFGSKDVIVVIIYPKGENHAQI